MVKKRLLGDFQYLHELAKAMCDDRSLERVIYTAYELSSRAHTDQLQGSASMG